VPGLSDGCELNSSAAICISLAFLRDDQLSFIELKVSSICHDSLAA
jgi:hypothetical protein